MLQYLGVPKEETYKLTCGYSLFSVSHVDFSLLWLPLGTWAMSDVRKSPHENPMRANFNDLGAWPSMRSLDVPQILISAFYSEVTHPHRLNRKSFNLISKIFFPFGR